MADLSTTITKYTEILREKAEIISSLEEDASRLVQEQAYWQQLCSRARIDDIQQDIDMLASQKETLLKSTVEGEIDVDLSLMRKLVSMVNADETWLQICLSQFQPQFVQMEADDCAAMASMKDQLELRTGHREKIAQLKGQASHYQARALEEQAAADAAELRAFELRREACASAVRTNSGAADNAAKARKLAEINGKLAEMEAETGNMRDMTAALHRQAAASREIAARAEAQAASIHSTCDAADFRRHQEAANLAANRRIAELASAQAAVQAYNTTGRPLLSGGPVRAPLGPIHGHREPVLPLAQGQSHYVPKAQNMRQSGGMQPGPVQPRYSNLTTGSSQAQHAPAMGARNGQFAPHYSAVQQQQHRLQQGTNTDDIL